MHIFGLLYLFFYCLNHEWYFIRIFSKNIDVTSPRSLGARLIPVQCMTNRLW